MRRKLTENLITILGCVGIIGTMANLFKMYFNELETIVAKNPFLHFILSDKFIAGISFLTFVLIIIWFHFKKYHLIDMYGTLYSMIRTNKLHSVREVIMVIFKVIQGKENNNIIDEAHFIYTILPIKEKNLKEKERYRDIVYEINLKINTTANISDWNIQNVFKFYFIIVNIGNGKKAEDIEVLVESKKKGKVFLIPTIINVTVSEVDKIQNIASLYEMIISVPKEWMRNEAGELWLKIKYRLPKDLDLAEVGNQKNFLIHPQNYGKKVNKFSVEIITEELQLYQAELQSIYPDLDYEENNLRSELTLKKEKEGRKIRYSLPGEMFKPYMKAVYIVQMEWNWQEIHKTALDRELLHENEVKEILRKKYIIKKWHIVK